jgi:hypothetical protein
MLALIRKRSASWKYPWRQIERAPGGGAKLEEIKKIEKAG